MGLFRRGTKLLRLGRGLRLGGEPRDCCCRPPEECWCPDPCVFYWSWGGSQVFPAKEYPLDFPCDFQRLGGELYNADLRDSFGLIDGDLDRYSSASGNPGTIEGGTTSGYVASSLAVGQGTSLAQVSYGGFLTGPLSYAAEEEIFGGLSGYQGSLGVGGALYSWNSSIDITCRSDANGVPRFFLYAFIDTSIRAEQVIDYRYSGGFDTDPDAVFDTRVIYNGFKAITGSGNVTGSGVVLALESKCTRSSELQCNEPSRAMKRMISELQLSIDGDGVYVNGQLFPWEVNIFGTPVDNRGLTELWKIDGQDPTGFSAILKMKDSCFPGVCDCDLDLTGRTVVFEGRTFTYGSLQQFISDDGLTIWEEGPSAGRFTRADRRECDPTVSMRVRTAEVSCSTFDGVPRWFVYLDSECYERENGGCAPTVTASKITLYSGAFSCDSDGYPVGAAHSFTDDTDPPDLDGENISGTPSTNCDVENPIPSISFS